MNKFGAKIVVPSFNVIQGKCVIPEIMKDVVALKVFIKLVIVALPRTSAHVLMTALLWYVKDMNNLCDMIYINHDRA